MSDERANRVLDAAGELLVTFGYRKVTIADVAARAGVGKGTVYLHWPSKLELFGAVLVREGIAVGRAHVAALRADPGHVVLHRTLAESFLTIMRRPLARALYTGDVALLGALASDTKIGRAVAVGAAAHQPQHLGLLYRHGLLADDPAGDPSLYYRLAATTLGFFVGDDLAGGAELTDRAAALGLVIRRAFEPAELPGPDALAIVAAEIDAQYSDLLDQMSRSLPDAPEEGS
ncbi:TetR/AcrR family transcriptional regulator [Actinomycetospora endophytica]|uniref:TetR/AcrR family transcriptional regulator n=1 Tax=Actinomycetospora endophytica TaxID=2291215 RepID=A0ABS8PDP8_9PSEU|nr:TetR/AcrR family transcriptional regulator [Actinomycetospora endophytica]MCD2196027.1 TetR/AcrR family transcriptional regulator [Actinomycetospora endophytica]